MSFQIIIFLKHAQLIAFNPALLKSQSSQKSMNR